VEPAEAVGLVEVVAAAEVGATDTTVVRVETVAVDMCELARGSERV